MTCYRVLIKTLHNPTYTYTRTKLKDEVEARHYARWLLKRNPNVITAALIEFSRDGHANASFRPSKASGMDGGRLVWWDDQPGDEPSAHALNEMDKIRRLALPHLQSGVSVSEPEAS